MLIIFQKKIITFRFHSGFLVFLTFFLPQTFFSAPQGYKKGEDVPIHGCVARFPEAVVVRVGDGKFPPIRIFPRKGEDFFLVFRKFPREVSKAEIQPFLKESERVVRGNHLKISSRYHKEGNLWIYSVARKESENLLEFFLSCD